MVSIEFIGLEIRFHVSFLENFVKKLVNLRVVNVNGASFRTLKDVILIDVIVNNAAVNVSCINFIKVRFYSLNKFPKFGFLKITFYEELTKILGDVFFNFFRIMLFDHYHMFILFSIFLHHDALVIFKVKILCLNML